MEKKTDVTVASEYVYVFISHKKEDMPKANKLQHAVKKLNYSCYIDGDDPQLSKLKNHPKEMAKRLRSKLRGCQCLIFLYSPDAIREQRGTGQ